MLFATPGNSPLADRDSDGLPDIYEIETYGNTNFIGNAINGDTDGDGASDFAEYIAGTSATNANSRFKLTANRQADGNVKISFQAEAINAPAYFNAERRYDLLQTTNPTSPSSWSLLPGYTDILGAGSIVNYTNAPTNTTWSVRARVRLQ